MDEMNKDLRIAAVCMNSPPLAIERNLDRISYFVSEASRNKVDIICFPELSTTGYILKDMHNVVSTSLTREILERLVCMSRESGLIILAGMIEKTDKENPYISHVVTGPDGLMGIYRKTHLSPQEKVYYRPGEKINVFSYGGITFGVQLFYEAHFPEISTVMALKGAKAIFIPHASPRGSPKEKIQSWLRHLTARAFDNALFIVACNQTGRSGEGFSFPGVAIALNPAGRVIAEYGENREHMLIAELNLDELREIRRHRMKEMTSKVN